MAIVPSAYTKKVKAARSAIPAGFRVYGSSGPNYTLIGPDGGFYSWKVGGGPPRPYGGPKETTPGKIYPYPTEGPPGYGYDPTGQTPPMPLGTVGAIGPYPTSGPPGYGYDPTGQTPPMPLGSAPPVATEPAPPAEPARYSPEWKEARRARVEANRPSPQLAARQAGTQGIWSRSFAPTQRGGNIAGGVSFGGGAATPGGGRAAPPVRERGIIATGGRAFTPASEALPPPAAPAQGAAGTAPVGGGFGVGGVFGGAPPVKVAGAGGAAPIFTDAAGNPIDTTDINNMPIFQAMRANRGMPAFGLGRGPVTIPGMTEDLGWPWQRARTYMGVGPMEQQDMLEAYQAAGISPLQALYMMLSATPGYRFNQRPSMRYF